MGVVIARDSQGKAGPYTWITYNQAHARAQRIATGLHTRLQLQRQDVVGVLSKNRALWILTETACNRMGYVSSPMPKSCEMSRMLRDEQNAASESRRWFS
ncbi:hypothetical protein As57867_011968, partial [Aphanomyces stellatus]